MGRVRGERASDTIAICAQTLVFGWEARDPTAGIDRKGNALEDGLVGGCAPPPALRVGVLPASLSRTTFASRSRRQPRASLSSLRLLSVVRQHDSPKAMRGRLAAQRSGAARGPQEPQAPRDHLLRRRRRKPTRGGGSDLVAIRYELRTQVTSVALQACGIRSRWARARSQHNFDMPRGPLQDCPMLRTRRQA